MAQNTLISPGTLLKEATQLANDPQYNWVQMASRAMPTPLGEPTPRKKLKLTKLQKARREVAEQAVELDSKVSWYCRRIDIGVVIDKLGDFNPLRKGRPIE